MCWGHTNKNTRETLYNTHSQNSTIARPTRNVNKCTHSEAWSQLPNKCNNSADQDNNHKFSINPDRHKIRMFQRLHWIIRLTRSRFNSCIIICTLIVRRRVWYFRRMVLRTDWVLLGKRIMSKLGEIVMSRNRLLLRQLLRINHFLIGNYSPGK